MLETMSRRSACSRGKDLKRNVSSKFANSPYLNSVQPKQSVSSRQSISSAHKEKKKCHDEEKHEKPHVESTMVAERQPKQSRRRGERGSRSINTHVPRGCSSVCSYQTQHSMRSSNSRSRQSSITRSIRRARIDILLPSEVEKMLIVFSSKHKDDSHPPEIFCNNHSAKHVQDDDSSIASASSMNDSLIFRECRSEVFSSELFANILAREPDQEGVSDLEG